MSQTLQSVFRYTWPLYAISTNIRKMGAVALQRRLLTGVPQGHIRSGPTDNTQYKSALKTLNRYQLRPLEQGSQPSQSTRKTPAHNTRTWLRLLGHDIGQVKIPKVIHVAGTKGKGTTCRYASRILIEHQKITNVPRKIGCLTSPHQIDVRERIMINNEKISKTLFSSYVQELDSKLKVLMNRQDVDTPLAPKYPGFLTLLACYIFIVEKVDVAILETGIGGETDSTNIFPHPVATGITTIGIDHVELLGDTREKIAWHKAGIFKPGAYAATVPQDKAVLQVLQKRAEDRRVAGNLHLITDQRVLEYGIKVIPDMPYQRQNAALGISLAEAYLKSVNTDFRVTSDMARSLEDVKLLGQSQVVEDRNNTWFITRGHNEISVKENVSWFKQCIRLPDRSKVLIFSSSGIREPYALLKAVVAGLREGSPVILKGVIFCDDRLTEHEEEKSDLIDLRADRSSMSSLEKQRGYSRIWEELGGSGNIEIVHTAIDAVRRVRENYEGAEILVTGSGYLPGQVLHVIQSATSEA